MADFKEQCSKVKSELQAAYKTKLSSKMDKFKNEYTAISDKKFQQDFENQIAYSNK